MMRVLDGFMKGRRYIFLTLMLACVSTSWATEEFSGEELKFFDSAIGFAERRYFDSSRFNPKFGYIQAAKSALSSLEESRWILLPSAGSFMIREREANPLPSPSGFNTNGILTDLESTWRDQDFDRKDFLQVMKFVYSKLDGSNPRRITVAAVNGFLSILDPYTFVFSRKSVMPDDGDEIYTIGVIIESDAFGRIFVNSVISNGSAWKAGLQSGDRILSIDHRSVTGLSLEKVIAMLRGAKGTTLKLAYLSAFDGKERTSDLARGPVEIQNVNSGILGRRNNIGYIRILSFAKIDELEASDVVSTHYKTLKEESKRLGIPLRALVLDLRNNPGGSLHSSVEIADQFLDLGRITEVKGSKEQKTETIDAKVGKLTELPLFVFVNSSTSSGAEIVAAAIRENGRGILLGQPTYGNTSVQKLAFHPADSNYFLQVTTGISYSSGGTTAWLRGIRPDIYISDQKDGGFPYKLRAKDRIPGARSEEEPITFDWNPIYSKNLIEGAQKKTDRFHVRGLVDDIFLIRALIAVEYILESDQ